MVFPAVSTTRPLGHFLLGGPLAVALLLGHAAAQAQVAPTPAPAQKPLPKNIACYVDGQKVDQATLAQLTPSAISHMQVINSAQQQQIFGTASADGTIVVTTKAKENSPEVLAFNKRISEAVPLTPATPAQTAAVAAVQAYMAKNYPAAKLQFVAPLKDQPTRYQAVFVDNGQRQQLLFDGQGQPVK